MFYYKYKNLHNFLVHMTEEAIFQEPLIYCLVVSHQDEEDLNLEQQVRCEHVLVLQEQLVEHGQFLD